MSSAKLYNIFLTIAVLGLLVIAPTPTHAAEFNKNNVMTDQQIQDYSSMSLADIQRFLERWGSTLGSYSALNFDENATLTAAEIIWIAANNNKINPKYLLALLQKEQSLIEDQEVVPTQYRWATGYAVCDSCDVTDPQIALFGGFGNQVELGARIMRKYFDKPEQYQIKVSKPTRIDGETVTPANQATANLYTYTPHVHGNFILWKIWNRYFGGFFPDGTLAKMKGSNDIWLIKNGERRKFESSEALVTRYDPENVIVVGTEDLEAYDEGTAITHAQFALLQDANGTKYLLVDDVLRPFESDEVFGTIGFNPEEVTPISADELAQYTIGTPITEYSFYPTGTIMRNKVTKEIFYVASSTKYPVQTMEVLSINFPSVTVRDVEPGELGRFLTGDPVKLRDSTLVKRKDSSTIYVISGGRRRAIPTMAIFKQYKYNTDNIVTVSQETLDLHQEGEDLQPLTSS